MKGIVTLLGVGILSVVVAWAGTNGNLTGTVKDTEGKPVQGATIRVLGTVRGAKAKSNGEYLVINIPAGTYTVKVTAIGYKEKDIEVTIRADQTTTLNVVLESAEIKGKEVVVESARLKMVDDKAVGITREVSGEQIQRTTRETAQQIALTQAGVLSTGGGLSIRGSRPTDTQIRIDGQDVSDQISGGFGEAAASAGIQYAPTASAFATEEVQVLTGNFSAQYGNAMGGVINQVIKTGKTDRYEGFLRWRTDVPFLFGTAGNGLRALAQNQMTYEFGVGGPIPLLNRSTFFVSTKYVTEEYRNAALDAKDRVGNSITRFPDNGSAIRNITGRLAFQFTDDIKLILGGTWGLTSLAFGNWAWLYANTPAMQLRYNPSTGLNDTVLLSTVPERVAKLNALNNFIYSYFARINHILSETSFYELTLSFNNNISEDGRRRIDLGEGSLLRNGQVQDPSKVSSAMPKDNFFTGWDILKPVDDYVLDRTSGLQVRRSGASGDKIIDYYAETFGTVYLDNDPSRPFYTLVPSNLTGYVEGASDIQGTSNPYGFLGAFYVRGNDEGAVNRGFEFKSASFWQVDGNYQLNLFAGDIRHLLKAGIDARYYTVRRYYNSLPWTGNPFYDVFTDQWGGDIYSLTPEERAEGSKPKYAIISAVYLEDQISYKGININPGVRIDVFDPSTTYRTNPADASSPDRKTASIKVQFNPRLYISYPVGDRSFFSIAYGWYTQVPRFSLVYNNTVSALTRGNNIVGNPDLRPENTKQYNVAYNVQLSDDYALDVQAFYKDIYGLTGLAYIPDNRFPYALVSNGEYGNARGIEITFRKRLTGNFGFNVNYTLSFAQGTSSSPGANYNVILAGADPFTGVRQFPLTEYPLDYDRRHRFNYIIDFVWGKGEGPSIGGIHFLENFAVNFTGLFQTGTPYTRLDLRGNQIGDFNAERQPSVWTLDMRLQRTLPLRELFGESFGSSELIFFLDVFNLPNLTGPVSVYPRTGDPDNDGVSLYRQPGDFPAGPWYARPDPANPATIAQSQYDRTGKRLYTEAADLNRDGIVTQQEQFQSYLQYVNDAISRRPRYQFPRTVFFGVMLRF